MIFFKKRSFLFFLFFVLNVLLIVSFLYREPDTNSRNFAKRLIYAWTESDAFLDDIYTFNIQGITDSLTRLLSVYDNENYKDICIILNLNSLSGGESKTEQVCTNNNAINNTTFNPFYIFDVPLSVGDIDFGQIKMYESNNSYNTGFILKMLFFISMVGYFLFFVYFFMIIYRLKSEKECLENSSENNDIKNKNKLNTLVKIISNNKQHFALNNDIVFATYEHPYSNLYYKNGNALAIRCSLLDLESLSLVDFVRLNKSSIVNSLFLKQEKIIGFRRDQSLVTVVIKKKEYEIIVSPVFKDNIF